MKRSIIITTYNAESTISLVLGALLKNLPESSEVVIVDDGSTDSTVKTIQEQDDDRINLVVAGKVGRAKALNIAVKNASGEIIYVNDADDVSFPDRFIITEKLLKSSDVVFGDALEIEDISNSSYKELLKKIDNKSEISNQDIQVITAKVLYKTNPLHHSTMAVKSSTLKNVGGYSLDISVCLDLDFYYKLVKRNYKIVKSNATFIARNTGQTRKFASVPSENYLKTLLMLRKKYRHELSPPLFTYLYDLKLLIRLLRLN